MSRRKNPRYDLQLKLFYRERLVHNRVNASATRNDHRKCHRSLSEDLRPHGPYSSTRNCIDSASALARQRYVVWAKVWRPRDR